MRGQGRGEKGKKGKGMRGERQTRLQMIFSEGKVVKETNVGVRSEGKEGKRKTRSEGTRVRRYDEEGEKGSDTKRGRHCFTILRGDRE